MSRMSCLKLLISVCIASISSFSSHSQNPHLPTGQTKNLLPGLAAVLDVRMRGVRPHPQGVFATTWFGKEEEEEVVDIGESDFQEEEERGRRPIWEVSSSSFRKKKREVVVFQEEEERGRRLSGRRRERSSPIKMDAKWWVCLGENV
ncbi:hypothetical protein LXL04_025315 [Taraxacum kok-saghyz]